ncbi:MAG: LLM class flavin-dependent oxidoreductase [Pseudomonadota bacterium]
MDVGAALIFQGTDPELSDRDVYRQELRLGDLAIDLGFNSIWSVEHHFTDYTMCPDVTQFLSYWAGRNSEVMLGSMVIVLPWHDPMRVAEEIAMLDNMSDGRMILGVGRGLGRVEFEGFGKDMNVSREYFTESAQMILEGLEQGYCEFDGQHIKQARRDIRPAPFKSFRGRTYAAAVSPESSQIMARLGVGILIVPQKPWDAVEKELASYRETYLEVNGDEAPETILAGWTFCHEDAGYAEEVARQYIGGYYQTVVEHYELQGNHLKNTKGYEAYVSVQENVQQAQDAMEEFFMSIQVWGTPEMCYDKIKSFTSRVNAGAYNGVFSFAGMPYALAEHSMRLFAREVMPEVAKLPGVSLADLAAA